MTPEEIKIRIIARDETQKAMKSAKSGMDGLTSAASALKIALVAIGSSVVIRKWVEVNKTFESLQMSLKTVTGSTETAQKSFKLITNVAKDLPFSVEELTRSFIKMKALGIDPTEETIRSFANTASAMGKSFDQFAEAVADAITGEFERLKEFGIKASQEGDKVNFTFQGVTTSVKKNSTEIIKYLKAIGEVQFAGATDEQMKTLSGALNNLGDSTDYLLTQIGGLHEFKQVIVGISNALRDMGEYFENINRQQGLFEGALNTKTANEVNEMIDFITGRIEELNRQLSLPKISLEGMLRDAFGSPVEDIQAQVQNLTRYLEILKDRRDNLADGAPIVITGTTPEEDKMRADKAKVEQEFNDLLTQANQAKLLEDEYNLRNSYAMQHELLQQLVDSNLKETERYAMAKARIEQKMTQNTMSELASGFSALGQYNRKAFAIGKAASIASAVINTYEGATKALATYAPPWSFAMAAAQVASGMAQVAQIKSQSFSGRAVGGPVTAGEPFMVGEQGRELFVPSQNGQIIKNSDLGGSSGQTNISFQITTVDATGFDDLLTSRRAMIVGMINRAMNEKGRPGIA